MVVKRRLETSTSLLVAGMGVNRHNYLVGQLRQVLQIADRTQLAGWLLYYSVQMQSRL